MLPISVYVKINLKLFLWNKQIIHQFTIMINDIHQQNQKYTNSCCCCFRILQGFTNIIYLDSARLFWGLEFFLNDKFQ